MFFLKNKVKQYKRRLQINFHAAGFGTFAKSGSLLLEKVLFLTIHHFHREYSLTKLKKIKADLEAIFKAGVKRVDPYSLILEALTLKGTLLTIDTGEVLKTFDLSQFGRIVVIGFGKATANMALALETLLGSRLDEGLIVVKYGHTAPLTRIAMTEAGHPVPDENGMKAARMIAELARAADVNTLVFTLISGGGSALIPYPIDVMIGSERITLSLAEKQETTRVLLECGATINEINCVRKHLSTLKGGRLAELLQPATSINLILSDVVGDRLDTIASGATTPDRSTFREMADVFAKYRILKKIPATVLKILEAGLAGRCGETPKPGSKAFDKTHTFLIGTNSLALIAAKAKADSLGYRTTILTSALTGEAKEVAKVLCAIGKQVQKYHTESSQAECILFGGETTVTIQGDGKGGRNQELALSFLSEQSLDRAATDRIYLLAASTDGNDGPTDAAGAFAAVDLLEPAQRKGLIIGDFLNRNDAYHFFAELDNLLRTGPTNTNVCDIQVVIVA
jgi:hydroxypyruvate reductase